MKAAILNDLTKCIGCEACVWACKESNDLPREDGAARLSDTTFTHLDHKRGLNVRRQCMHCEHPACASVCPVGALTKSAEGPVVYDADKCIGCRYCMVACPFEIPRYEWGDAAPFVKKCEMCFDTRVSQGRKPACTQVCPTGATTFGDREELLREAHRRIQAEPGRYVNHVYGETEAGGTSVFYLSPVPFEELGFKTEVRHESYPDLTWNALSKIPSVVSVAGVGLVGIWWVIRRRDEVARAEGRGPGHSRPENDEG